MKIRRATVDDLAAITLLEEELFAGDAWSLESVTEEVTGPHRHSFVACADDDTVVGYVVAMQFDEVVDLHRIAVVPTGRRTGVARSLLAAVQQAGSEGGAQRMLLEVSDGNEAALRFYADAGFEEIDRRSHYYRDGTDALVLRLSLAGGGGS
ncbi:MAG TPA: ribosomal protein S18-alanine N-acetyltransferase [Marmoricola sp.]|nr:ribosomal protein S18-alanine N-acetyltransferase [Marmoricola sp.]